MSAAPLRVAVIGAGANTLSRHIPGLLATGHVRIAAIANRTPESSKNAAVKAGLLDSSAAGSNSATDDEQLVTNEPWQDVVRSPLIDAVMIGTWPNTHALIATEALKAGKHVLCEARMAMDAAQAKEMLQVARRTPDCVAMLVPSPFTLKFDALIQKTIAEGHLGKILVIDVLGQTPGFVNPDAPMHWRQREDFSGDNVMLMGIFYEALVRWVGEASTVMAMGSTFVPVRRESSEGKLLATRIPDHLDVLCKMQCGAQARLQFSSVMGGKPAQSNQFTLYGTDGSLRLDLDQGEVQLARKTVDDGAWQNLEIASDAKGWRVEQEFINAVLGEEDVKFTTFEDGARYMEFTSAVRRSLQSQSIVTLGNALA